MIAFNIILIILSVGTVFYLFFQSIYVVFNWFSRTKNLIKKRTDLPFMGHLRKVLSEKNSFYAALSPESKSKFEKRVILFMDDMDFEGKNGLLVTQEMIILISASAVQLTFGLKKFLFTNYVNILVFPGEFYSRSIGRNIKGGVARENIIALSWPDFASGYEIGDDNYNLGLHEMTHALKSEAIYAEASTHRFRVKLKKWLEEAKTHIDNIKSGKITYFRKYAATNEDEFFSVSIEYFFESPDDFKARFPELYSKLCGMMNLDPANRFNDFKPEKKDPFFHYSVEQFSFLHYEYVRYFWFRLLLVPLLINITAVHYMINFLLITLSDLFIIYTFLFFFGIVPFLFFRQQGFTLVKYLQLNTFTIAPTLLSFMLLLNFSFLGPTEKISGKVINKQEILMKQDMSVQLTFDNEKLNQCINSGFFWANSRLAKGCDSVEYEYKKGLVGIPVVEEIHLYASYKHANGKSFYQNYSITP